MRIYEISIGVPDLADASRYFAAFGFSGGSGGRLNASASKQLYGVDSAVQSLRMRHQVADHGLIRLMAWDQPANEGLGLAPMASLGSRWTAQHTADLARIEYHAEAALSLGAAPFRMTRVVGGTLQENGKARWRPFWDDLSGAREFAMFQPYFRQLFYSRYFHSLPNYGAINHSARFPTSQVTHAGLILQGDEQVLDFYVEHLGMVRTHNPPRGTATALPLFDLPAGETEWYLHWVQDAGSSSSDYGRSLSGRLIVLRFPGHIPLPDLRGSSSTGSLGMSSYSVQVPDPADMAALQRQIGASAATDVSDILRNEFDEPSFSFRAPDGYTWIATGR